MTKKQFIAGVKFTGPAAGTKERVFAFEKLDADDEGCIVDKDRKYVCSVEFTKVSMKFCTIIAGKFIEWKVRFHELTAVQEETPAFMEQLDKVFNL